MDNAAETVGPKTAEDMYAALRIRLAGKPAAAEALQDPEKAPTDAESQAALRDQFKKILAEDEEFAASLQKPVDEASRSGARTKSTRPGSRLRTLRYRKSSALSAWFCVEAEICSSKAR